jgi:membrane-anchored protein YejM (alkaline phosphatase superfamily)
MQDKSMRRLLARWWGWLIAATTLGSLVIGLRFLAMAEPAGSAGTLLFRGVMMLGHLSSLAAILLLPVLLVAAILPRPRLVIPLGVGLSTLLLLSLLADTQVFQLYRFHINSAVLELLTGGAAAATFVFPVRMWLLAASIAMVVVFWQAWVARLAWRQVEERPRLAAGRPLVVVLATCCVAYHLTHAWAAAVGFAPLTRQTALLPLNKPMTAKRFLRRVGVHVPTVESIASEPGSGQFHYPREPLDCPAPPQRPNIVMIVIDSWRFDALTPEITPNIHRFAGGAATFEDHWSGANATRTGIFTLFYGLPGTYWHSALGERRGPAVISALLQQQYRIEVFRSTPLYSPELDKTVFTEVPGVRLTSDGSGAAEWDYDLTRDFLAFLDTRKLEEPFFSFLFYDSPHAFALPPDYQQPLQPTINGPANYLTLGKDTDPVPTRNRYFNSVHYVDSLVGQVIERLENDDLLKESVVIITGDHGQEFNENGLNYWGHNGNFSRWQAQVPFVLHASGVTAGRHGHRTSHMDVMATLMDRYLGCRNPASDHSVGRDLFEPGGRDVLVMSGYGDFAIVLPDHAISVRRHDTSVVDQRWHLQEHRRADPAAIGAALEINSRFFRTEWVTENGE